MICSKYNRLLTVTTAIALAIHGGPVHALPAGGSVSSGSASISTSANSVTVAQSSSRAVLNWQSFNLLGNDKIRFEQPSSSAITLNRVTGPGASAIDGQLTANGNVWVINPQGVVFGKNAQVNVGGLLVSTSAITDSHFMAGQYDFTPGGIPNATVSNEGSITVNNAGLAAFVAPNVMNSGLIDAKLGKVALASGDSFTVDLYGDGLINLQASAGITSQAVNNTGTLKADGGSVAITAAAASSMVDSLINLNGLVEAQSVGGHAGSIEVYAAGSNAVARNSPAGKGQLQGSSEVLVSGTLDASGYQRICLARHRQSHEAAAQL